LSDILNNELNDIYDELSQIEKSCKSQIYI